MVKGQKRLPASFYRSATGADPVREWLRALPVADRRTVGHDIATAELGWPVGMPLCRSLGGGIWEIRSNLPSKRIARVLFCAAAGQMVLLHAFIKKTQQTAKADLDLARKRKTQIEL